MLVPIDSLPALNMYDEYTHIVHDITQLQGEVRLAPFAKLCAARILAGFDESEDVDSPGEPWQDAMTTYIYHTVLESNIGLSATIAALSLIERYQDMLLKTSGDCVIYEVEGACRLFLAAYMAGVKVMYDEQPRMHYWTRVTDFEYTYAELVGEEMQFYDVMEWMVTIDPRRYTRIYEEMMNDYIKLEGRLGAPWVVLSPIQKQPLRASDSTNTIEEVPRVIEEIPGLDEEDEKLFVNALGSQVARRSQKKPTLPLKFFRKGWCSSKS